VAARDIERIQVPALGGRHGVPLESSTAPNPQPQVRLFPFTPRPDSIHPDIVTWANQPPFPALEQKLRLSASAIEDYLACPLKFKLGHYLKIPTGPQAALTFGNIMHQCVRQYFHILKKTTPQVKDIEDFYHRAWRGVGFTDSYQEQSYKKAGLDQLRQFVERQNASGVPAYGIRMEEHFSLDLGEAVLEGRIDQINPLGEHTVELIDYKTGRPRSEKDAEKSLQLSIYALAAREQLKSKATRLTFYNLTNNQPVSTVRTERNLHETIEVVREVAGKIRGLMFSPTPGFVCKRCDFVPICPAHEDEY
jgi:DNA helicase-2/ATP-dependent DNA helicase PcrA